MSPLEGQILDQLTLLLDPLAALAGKDLVDPMRYRLVERVDEIAATLMSEDEDEARCTATALMRILFPPGTEPVPSWWRTPLGKACIRHTLERFFPEGVAPTKAARILGIGSQRVYQLAADKPQHPGAPPKLEALPEGGGVTCRSVAERTIHPVTPTEHSWLP